MSDPDQIVSTETINLNHETQLSKVALWKQNRKQPENRGMLTYPVMPES